MSTKMSDTPPTASHRPRPPEGEPDNPPFHTLVWHAIETDEHWSVGGHRLEFGDELVAELYWGAHLPGFFLPGGSEHRAPALAFDEGFGWPLALYYSTVVLAPWAMVRRAKLTRHRAERPPIPHIQTPAEREMVLSALGALRFPFGPKDANEKMYDLDQARWLRLLLAEFDRRTPTHQLGLHWDDRRDCDCRR